MIEARGLTKRYGDTLAVDHLSFGGEPGTPTPVLQLGRLPEVLHDPVLLPAVEPPDCHPAYPLGLDRDLKGVGPAPVINEDT